MRFFRWGGCESFFKRKILKLDGYARPFSNSQARDSKIPRVSASETRSLSQDAGADGRVGGIAQWY
jgi:hypothetical protein